MGIKKQNIFIPFFLFIASSSTLLAASISFVAKNTQGEKLEEVYIYTSNPGITSRQVRNVFVFENLEIGTYIFYISADLHKNQTKTITIRSKDDQIVENIVFEEYNVILDTIELSKTKTTSIGDLSDDILTGSKKIESINVQDINGNKSTNNARQIFGKSPLTNIVVTDGAGIQLGIGARGLDPSRSSNFTIRQNGYDISADALGYPESYYTPPSEALEKIEVLRGAASLQYGTQFGGVVNFKLISSYDKPFAIKSRQTYGSYNLFNSFNSIGGTTERGVKYFAYYQRKSGNDYRPNAEFALNNFYGHIQMPISEKIILGLDQTYMNYLSHQPGGLTDAEFEINPRQSNRTRNWFEIKWYVPALTVYYFPNPKWTVSSKFFGLVAERNSVGNLGPINRSDDLLSNRDIILGKFKNVGNETRAIYDYKIKQNQCYLSTGFKAYTAKNQSIQGIGDNASDANFVLKEDENINNDFTFPNQNLAFFAENIFHLGAKWSVTPGMRLEHINTNARGYYRNKTTDLAGNVLENKLTNEELNLPRTFVISGIGASYRLKDSLKTKEIYTNLTQNYRSVTFSDLRTNNPSLVIDRSIHDEKGYNFDLGYRAITFNKYKLDASFFVLKYNDRIGETLKKFSDPVIVLTTKRYRSNIADALVYGLEFFGEYKISDMWCDSCNYQVEIFGNTALVNSRYINPDDRSIHNNQVEYAPNLNVKAGVTYKRDKLSCTLQSSYTSKQFSDASNAVFIQNAIVGEIPSYLIFDFSMALQLHKNISIESGINNFANESYFTKRTSGYPGPGILPAAGRNAYLTLEVRL